MGERVAAEVDHISTDARDGDFPSRVPSREPFWNEHQRRFQCYFKAPKQPEVWLTKDGRKPMDVLQEFVKEQEYGLLRSRSDVFAPKIEVKVPATTSSSNKT